MGITPEQFREMEARNDANRKKGLATRPAPVPATATAAPMVGWPWPLLPFPAFDTREFTYHGSPIGKPRMTRSDKWKKRPRVLKYRAFCDSLRAASGVLPEKADMVLVTAYCPMPLSWSGKKKAALNGKPCRSKPDWDNIGKAVCDALFDEDCCIWLGLTIKYWCFTGEERLNVKVLYAKS
jgi:Holliday junction resolvase RusA-like endonuclease